MTIKGSAVREGNGTTSVENGSKERIPDAHTETVIADMKNEKAQDSRKESGCTHSAEIGAEENSSFMILGQDELKTILCYGIGEYRHK